MTSNADLLQAIDQCLAEIRASYSELPLEPVAPAPATSSSVSERWLLAAVYSGHNVREIALAKPVWTVPAHKYIYRTLIVSRMVRPEGLLLSSDLDGLTEADLAILRSAIKAYPGKNPNIDEHLSICGGTNV